MDFSLFVESLKISFLRSLLMTWVSVCSQHNLQLVYLFIFAFSFETSRKRHSQPPLDLHGHGLWVGQLLNEVGSPEAGLYYPYAPTLHAWKGLPLERSFKIIICSVRWDHRYESSSLKLKKEKSAYKRTVLILFINEYVWYCLCQAPSHSHLKRQSSALWLIG